MLTAPADQDFAAQHLRAPAASQSIIVCSSNISKIWTTARSRSCENLGSRRHGDSKSFANSRMRTQTQRIKIFHDY